ncbi:MAG: hypothetical protein WCO23_04755 [bacterium]
MRVPSQKFIDAEIRSIKNPFRKALAILLIVAIGITFLVLITKPLRGKWAQNYIQSGDEFLINKQYLHARLEYEKSNIVRRNNEARERIKLSQAADGDITKLADFLAEKKPETFALIQQAEKISANTAKQTELARAMIDRGEYQIAIIAADTAVQMDPSYRDAWLYLGISDLKCGQSLEIDKAQQKVYFDNARAALTKAQSIDPEYQVTKDYLKAIK